MMKRSILILLVGVLLYSCAQQEKMERFEGILIYKTDDPMLDNVPVDSGSYIKYFVQGDSVRVESYTAMGKQVHLRFNNKKEAVLIMVHAGKKIALLQDLSKDTIQRGFTFEPTNENEEIAGVQSKKGTIKGGYLEKPMELCFAEHFPNNIIQIYDGVFPGLPTKYQLLVQQMLINYELVKVQEGDIDLEKFNIPNDCLVLTMEEFMELLANPQTEE